MPLHKFNNPGLVYYKALSKYLELVQEIPEVVEVRLSEDDTLYTVISTSHDDDDILGQVIDVELAVMRNVKTQPFQYRVVNFQRMPQEGLKQRIGNLGGLIWKGRGVPETTESKEGIVAISKLNNPGLIYYQALSKYLELVKEIPEVVEVRLSADDTLCTIISATPHDDGPRYRVFKAEGVVVRSMEQQPFLFDLVNRRELPEGASERLSSLGDLVWKR